MELELERQMEREQQLDNIKQVQKLVSRSLKMQSHGRSRHTHGPRLCVGTCQYSMKIICNRASNDSILSNIDSSPNGFL